MTLRPARGLLAGLAFVLATAGCTSDTREVVTGTVERGTVTEVVEAPATVTARAVAGVRSPADGTVSALLVDSGATVRAGTALLRISSPSATAALRAALAARAAARDAVAQALATSNLQSAQQVVDALTVRAPLDGVVVLGGTLPTGDAGAGDLLGSLPGALQGVAGDLLGGGSRLGGSEVTTGDLAVGAPVGTGTPLLTVTDVSALGLSAEVDETDVLLVTKGTRAQVQLDALPGEDYTGEVTSVDLSPVTSTRGGVGYRVRLALSGDPRPRPGMSAVVRLQVREATGALSVPAAAVVRDGAEDVVFAVTDGTVRRRVVEVGAQGEDRVEVRNGLREGDVIVVRDADGLRDGQQVES